MVRLTRGIPATPPIPTSRDRVPHTQITSFRVASDSRMSVIKGSIPVQDAPGTAFRDLYIQHDELNRGGKPGQFLSGHDTHRTEKEHGGFHLAPPLQAAIACRNTYPFSSRMTTSPPVPVVMGRS